MKKINVLFLVFCFLAISAIHAAGAISENLETAILYLGQPKFAGENFFKKICGVEYIEVDLINLDEEMIYLQAEAKKFNRQDLNKFAVNPEKIVFGKTKDGRLTVNQQSGKPILLGKINFFVPETYYFRISFENFKIANKRLIYQFKNQIYYDISLEELTQFRINANAYNGRVWFAADGYRLANHGAWVVKKKPSLARLANRITIKSNNTLDKVQALLDFVNNDISYNQQENLVSYETMKNPNEVLMVGNGDCSGKATLFSSLLEQINVNYRLIYLQNHLSVAVEVSPVFQN